MNILAVKNVVIDYPLLDFRREFLSTVKAGVSPDGGHGVRRVKN